MKGAVCAANIDLALKKNLLVKGSCQESPLHSFNSAWHSAWIGSGAINRPLFSTGFQLNSCKKKKNDLQPWPSLLKAPVWENKHFFCVFGWISSLHSDYFFFLSQFVYVMLRGKKITSPSKTREPNGAALYPHAWLTSPQKWFKHQVSEKHTISNASSPCPFPPFSNPFDQLCFIFLALLQRSAHKMCCSHRPDSGICELARACFFFFFVWKPARHFFQTDPVSAYSEGKGLLFFFQRCYGKFNLFALIHLHPRRSTRKPHSRGQFLASRRFCPVSYSPVRDYRLNIIFMS